MTIGIIKGRPVLHNCMISSTLFSDLGTVYCNFPSAAITKVLKASSPCVEYNFQRTSALQIGTARLIIPLSCRELSSPVPMAELLYGLGNFHWQLLDHTCRQDNSNREKMMTSSRTLSYQTRPGITTNSSLFSQKVVA